MKLIDSEKMYDILRKVRDEKVRIRGWWSKDANRRSMAIIASLFVPIAIIYIIFLSPPANFPSGEIITIERGSTLSEVSQQLQDENIVRLGILLRVLVSMSHGEASVVAGDYQFNNPANIFAVTHKITTGAFGLVPIRVRIPEGATVTEMASIYSKQLKRFNEDAFIEQAKPLEGYMFPDTYFFLPNADEQVVVRTMLSNFELQIESLKEDLETSEHPLSDIIIMASLLEKEARIYEDRQKIAGVLWRRISIDMALQVDAAFLYFLGRTTFDLTKKDLQTDSPYNTYKYKGLPIGPIANPGLSSIRAALNPIDTGALFYLADNNGVTYYSKTYEEHLAKKYKYLGY